MKAMQLSILAARIDARSKAILERLKSAGMATAHVVYEVDEAVVSLADFDHLQRHGVVTLEGVAGRYQTSIVAMFARDDRNPEARTVGFRLNVDLV